MNPTSNILYEPNASVMKAGCWHELEEAFGIESIGENSHLYLTDHPIPAFPGRGFDVLAVRTLSREDSAALSALGQANITTRNFPMKPDELRKRLHLRDGGDIYLFATTDIRRNHRIYVCQKHAI